MRKFWGVVFALVGALLLLGGVVNLVMVVAMLFSMESATAYSSGFVAGRAVVAILFSLLGVQLLRAAYRRLFKSPGVSPSA